MKRDKKGRFTEEDFPNERYEFKFYLPSLKNFIFIILLILIFLPRTVLFPDSNFWKKYFNFLMIS